MAFVIGLMSGTSVDGIDAALVNISGNEDLKVELLAGATYPYPADLRSQILACCGGAAITVAQLAQLDDAIAFCFAQAAQNIQKSHPTAKLIGSHGQTVYHRPPCKRSEGSEEADENASGCAFAPDTLRSSGNRGTQVSSSLRDTNQKSKIGYSLQLGRGAAIAHLTGITTVSNFRAADIAVGGQGAPLVPKVDAYLLGHPQESRCIQNIGGIGNLTYLPARNQTGWSEKIRGWDTGPGNTLLDLAVQHLTDGAKTYDEDGNWASSGTPCYPLVEKWLSGDFFQQPPPKSTGRELFGEEYLQQCLIDATAYELRTADLLATLTELTAASIVHSYRTFLPQLPQQVLLCGGGSRNLYLRHRLQTLLEQVPVLTTDEVGLSADFKEAIAFAILAYWRQLGISGNLPLVTGAKQPVLLGDIYEIHNS